VGGFAFLIDFGSLYSLTEFAGYHYLTSAAIAFLLGLLTNYSLCRLWVFDRRTMESASLEFLIFGVIGIVGLGLNELIMWFAGEVIHLHYLVGKVISAGIVLIWNFGARKLILFR
jgi:putative flippase GtrA